MTTEIESLNTMIRWMIFLPIATVLAGILAGHIAVYFFRLFGMLPKENP
jgi:hypothetical protein